MCGVDAGWEGGSRNANSQNHLMTNEMFYVFRSNCDSSAANILRQHYEKPYFLPRVAESSKTDWIFMGSPGYGAHLHVGFISIVLPKIHTCLITCKVTQSQKHVWGPTLVCLIFMLYG